jgi:hypothetical protein
MHKITLQKVRMCTFKQVSCFILALAVITFFSCRSNAAEISCIFTWDNNAELKMRVRSGRLPASSICQIVLIKGEIVSGDSAKFAEFLNANNPFLETVDLWSSGGLVEEGMKIGRLVRKSMLATRAPSSVDPDGTGRRKPDGTGSLMDTRFVLSLPSELADPNMLYTCNGNSCHCASACFLIWAAGIERYGNSLGLHRPSIRSTSFANLPPDRASALYRTLLAEVGSYLMEMDVPRRFIDIMTDTSSSDIRWLEDKEASSIEEVPSVAEWIAATCGAMSKEEEDVLMQVGDSVTRSDRMRYERLMEKSSDIAVCKLERIDKARDAIAVPIPRQ